MTEITELIKCICEYEEKDHAKIELMNGSFIFLFLK